MTFASEGSYTYSDSLTSQYDRQVRQKPSVVKAPRLVGWRISSARRPQLEKIIRKFKYSSNRTASEDFYQVLLASVLSTSARRHRQKNGVDRSTTWDKEKQKADREFRREFQVQAEKWRKDTAIFSSVSDIVLHPSYQRIIGMGPDVVPLILRDLERTNDHWFWALEAITGVNPIADEDRGRVKQIAKRWLDWGKAQQLL